MTDLPFEDFNAQPPPAAVLPAKKKTGNKRRGRPARQPAAAIPVASQPKPGRRRVAARRQARAAVPKSEPGIKVDLATSLAVGAGIKEADGKLLVSMVTVLQNTSKPVRRRIVQALGKLFA